MRTIPAATVVRLAAVLAGVAVVCAACAGDDGPTAPADTLPPGWLAGRVQDDTGAALAGVRVVDAAATRDTVTGPDGRFALGPFAPGDSVVLVTETPDTVSAPGADDAWYDVRTPPLPADTAGPVLLTLITRYAIELEGVASWLPSNDHFSHFLEYACGSPTGVAGPNPVWSWTGGLPLRVLVRDSLLVRATDTDTVTIDTGACVRAAMARWNEAAGRDLLVETDDPAAAQVTTAYPALPPNTVGQCHPADPDSCGFRACVPTVVELRLSATQIPDAAFFTEIGVHEFGHALGFWGHVASARGIMKDGVRVPSRMTIAGGASGSPIHPLEVRAIVARTHIPPGTALEQYEGTAPDFADFPPVAAVAPGEDAP